MKANEVDLEEAAKHYLYSNILYDDVYVGNPTDKDCIEMFKAGAKWADERQAEKDLKLTWEDISDIIEIHEDVLEMESCENVYMEVLKRFREKKGKNYDNCKDKQR